MQLVLFWVFAALMLLFGAAVVFLRNPVSNALSLVMSFVFLAALFVTLDAFFIGVVQVLVYAGAVMVLFLFIIMLLNLRSERPRPLNIGAWTGGGLVVFGFAGRLGKVLSSEQRFDMEKPLISTPQISDVSAVGVALFRYFNLPFQIIGVLLLVATVGVVILSNKELK
ncbi:MAG TPA: NADH-quinone oxidoreductase subunit J [Terrimicrobiaceae bacterium]